MKKIFAAMVFLFIITAMCGCNTGADSYLKNSEDYTNGEMISSDKSEDYRNGIKKAPDVRTEDLSYGISDDAESFACSYDFDFDGISEDIVIRNIPSEQDGWNDSDTEVMMGSYKKTLETQGAYFEAAYACDIDTSDGLMELAFITSEYSGDPVLRIFKYDQQLSQYEFYKDEDWMDVSENVTDWYLGYAVTKFFNVNDDDSITVEEQTPSSGMWSVYKTYHRNENGVFVEKKPEYYEVIPDFMENNYIMTSDADEQEKNMWSKGFVKAHADYKSNGFAIKSGEYFKVVYDDGENNIYIEKQDGQSGWICLERFSLETDITQLNPYFFFVAG